MKRNTLAHTIAAILGAGFAFGNVGAFADNAQTYTLQGNCAKLPQDRATEFHGNPKKADLFLGMAGNQWVVFEEVLRGFNAYNGVDSTAPDYKTSYTKAELRSKNRDYYVQLIPPGTIRDQIKSGCITLGNDETDITDRNFLPLNIQVDFDVFTSTNYNLMKDLASNGFLTEAMPYTKNQLELAVADGNPHGIGDGVMPAGVTPKGDAVVDKIVDTVFDLLDPNVPVSEVDHINEGIHSAINGMYQSMDAYVRANGTASQIDELDARLAAVAVPQDGSPGKTRPATEGIKTNFNLASNAACNYGNGTLKFCEFAILNKANTHETRVHHVETPTLVRSGDSYTGPLWVTEVKYAQKAQDADASLGKLVGIGVNNAVNTPQVYSIALLATSGDATLANSFINWVRSAEGQQVYVDGGFLPLSDAELAGGKCYSLVNGALSETNRANNLCP